MITQLTCSSEGPHRVIPTRAIFVGKRDHLTKASCQPPGNRRLVHEGEQPIGPDPDQCQPAPLPEGASPHEGELPTTRESSSSARRRTTNQPGSRSTPTSTSSRGRSHLTKASCQPPRRRRDAVRHTQHPDQHTKER